MMAKTLRAAAPQSTLTFGQALRNGREAVSEIVGEVSTGDRITFQLSQFQSMDVVVRMVLPH
jgi:hypothetical protein